MQPPFFCDYGSNILLGERVFFNFNCVVLDVCQVTIGDFTLFGPAVQIYTATHPMNAELRRKQEFAKPIEIGSDVWVGGGAILCPGRADRLAVGHRRRQRGHAGHPRGRLRRRQPLPGHPGDHRIAGGVPEARRSVVIEPRRSGCPGPRRPGGMRTDVWPLYAAEAGSGARRGLRPRRGPRTPPRPNSHSTTTVRP